MSGFSRRISRMFNSDKKNAQIHNDKITFHYMASKEIQKKIDKLNENCKDDAECQRKMQELMDEKEIHDVKYDSNIPKFRSLQQKLARRGKTINSRGGKKNRKRKTAKKQKQK